jgi:16S rRNA (uracil1498-N3)-methyltransferase
VFVSDLDTVSVDESDRLHLGRVLRLRRAESVTASDGKGRWRICAIAEAGDVPVIVPTGDIAESSRPTPAIEIGVPLLKGGRLEWAVQKCTEVGVDRIVPLDTCRGVVRWSKEQERARAERLRRVARDAAMQSRRAWLPEVTAVTTVAALAQDVEVAGRTAMAQRGGPPPDLSRPFILVGPEGGFDPAELAWDLPATGLGPTLLRSETAALAGAILLSWLRAV